MKLADKIRTIAREIYRAADIAIPAPWRRSSPGSRPPGFGKCRCASPRRNTASPPTRRCMGAPTGHILPVREVRLSAGAGFVVAICGDIMTMPGLPRVPAAEAIHLRDDGEIEGLF